MRRTISHILIWLLVFSLGLSLTGCTRKAPPDAPPPPPVAAVDTAMTAGERAAARLQQTESGLMADGLRVPLPPPPAAPEE